MSTPISAVDLNGAVWIKADPQTARDLAQAWAGAHTSDFDADQRRPRWHDDVVTIARAAAMADVRAERVPAPVHLQLVQTGDAS